MLLTLFLTCFVSLLVATALSALPIALIPSLTAPALWPQRGAALVDASTDEPLGEGQAIVAFAAFWLMVLCGLACLAALALRFRRSRGMERQQLKWLLFASTPSVSAGGTPISTMCASGAIA